MKIAICDDVEDQLNLIKNFTNEYLTKNGITAEILTFSQSDKLIRTLGKENFQIYILDIVMPIVNGIELGIAIRKLDIESQIIYTTSAPEYALESFLANPINYLIKPINKFQFFATLSLAFSKINTVEKSISVKTKEGIRVLNFFSIMYCEKKNNIIKYVLKSGEIVNSITVRTSFSDQILPILQDERFLQPHSSYAVNMNYIEGMDERGFTLKGGDFVPITQKQHTVVLKTYFDFMFKK